MKNKGWTRDLTEADNDTLTMDVSDEEILEAVKQMNAFKAPGPDGIQATFYIKSWNIIGNRCAIWFDLSLPISYAEKT